MVLALVACSDDARPASDGSQAPSASSGAAPSPGAAGAGDPYYPNLGNGGYDVEHYDLLFTVDPRTNLLDATATISATATQSLSRFNLDLLGLQIQSLKVDGLDAEHSRDGGELVITPSQPIGAGESFTVTVLYVGSPEPRSTKAIPIAVGWIFTGDGSFVLNEPEGASTWYPVNDHPSDKATYTFHLTVPDGVAAIANGTLVRQVPAGNGQTTWTYEAKDPIASYLTQVAIGDYQLTTTPGPNGVTIRNAFASPLAEDATVDFSRTPEMLEFFATQFGPYPFDVYGALVINERKGAALETQTLSIFDSSFVDGSVQGDGVVAHELAHQWFGNSVTLASWKDVWLNEGFATYAEWLWHEHADGTPVATTAVNIHEDLADATGALTGDPGVEQLFNPGLVYVRGALTLHALRLTIGDDAFFTTLRTYAARFADKNVTTDDFIQVASETAGRDLRELFDAWLYREELPALPS